MRLLLPILLFSTMVQAQHPTVQVWDSTNIGFYQVVIDTTIKAQRFESGIAFDKENNYYIGTYAAGMFVFNGKDWSQITRHNSDTAIISEIVGGLFYDDDDESLWTANLGVSGASMINNTDTVRYTPHNTGGGFPSSWNTYHVIKDSSDRIWIGTDGGVARFDGYEWRSWTVLKDSLPSDDCQSLIFHEATNRVLVGTAGGGIIVFSDTNWTVVNTSNSGLTTNTIWALEQDSGRIWVGTAFSSHGLNLWDDTTWSTFLPGQTVRRLAVDDSGAVWAGTFSGLYKVHDSVATLYNTGDGLPDNNIKALGIDRKGNVCVGTREGFAVFNPHGIAFTTRFDIDHICPGDPHGSGSATAMPNWGTPPYSYFWQPNLQTTPGITGQVAGSYICSVTDFMGWSTTDTLVIGQSSALGLDTTLFQPTYDDTNGLIIVKLTGGTPPYQYRWSNGKRTRYIRNVPGGKTWIKVIDANGCVDSIVFVFSSGVDDLNSVTPSIYPNPAMAGTKVVIGAVANNILVQDLLGRTLYHTRQRARSLTAPPGRGMYIVSGVSNGAKWQQKLVVH